MRARLTKALQAAALLPLLLLLAACGDPGLERIDVTWATDPPPRWGLYPGYRQEIPCPKGSVYHVDVYKDDKPFTGGSIGDPGWGLAFKPTAGARDIEAVGEGRDRLTLYVTLRNDKGEARRLTALRVERKGEKISFEFPKQP